MSLREILDDLKFVPSFFTLDISNYDRLKTIKAKLNEAEECEHIEYVNDNFVSFICFISHDFKECESKLNLTIEHNPKNIQANVLKCVLNYYLERYRKAEELLDNIKIFSKEEYLMVEAKSELAYALSRMGPQFYQKAIVIYEEVTSKYPAMYGWKYRLALTIRRMLRPYNLAFTVIKNDLSVYFKGSKTLFEDVIKNSEREELRALSYVSLAILVVDHQYTKFNESLSDEARKEKALEYLRDARKCAPKIEKVLTETGRMLRRIGHIEEARMVLEEATAIRETSTNCHHLGLSHNENPDQYIEYLQKSVDLSKGYNEGAVESLGLAHLNSKPPNFEEAMGCFKALMNSASYAKKRNGAERTSKCCLGLFKLGKIEFKTKINFYRQKCMVFAALECLQQPSSLQVKIPVEELFSDLPYEAKDKFNCYDQYNRIIKFYGNRLPICNDIKARLNNQDINKSTTDLIYNYFENKRYMDCLDVTTILLATTVEDIEKIAVDVMMKIVEETSDDLDLTKTCFTRAMHGLCSTEAGASQVRIIYDVDTCEEEFILLEEWLTDIDLKVVKNDQDIVFYMERQQALISSMSANNVIICLFKHDETGFMEDYPIDLLPVGKPVVIPVTINNSQVASNVAQIETMRFPDPMSKSTWLSEFGRRIFSSAINSSE